MYVRGARKDGFTKWQQDALEELFEKDAIAAAINAAVKEYETNPKWGGDRTKKFRRPKSGVAITGQVVLTDIIVDSSRKEVILCGTSETDANLAEHGVCIYRRGSRWRFDNGDYLVSYLNRVEVEIAEVQIADSSKQTQPARDASSASLRKASNLSLNGTWKLDEVEYEKSLLRLGCNRAMAQPFLARFSGSLLEFSQEQLVVSNVKSGILKKFTILGCKHKGNRISLRYRDVEKRVTFTDKFQWSGEYLADSEGRVFRRA